MLESLRLGARTWVAKILFALLVFSFAIWGVADVFTGYGRGSIASVGSTEIPVEDFQRTYQNELDRVSSEANQRITAEQGRQFGLDRRVLSQLVGSAAIETHAGELGMKLSDQTLADGIQTDPDFKGPDGKFSKAGFDNLLRQLGVSEKGFFNLRRKDELRTHIIGAFVGSQAVPRPLIDALHAYNQEKRVIEWVAINAGKVITIAEPDDAKLKELYEKDKAQFMTPEFRKFEVLQVSVDDLKASVTVSDADIAASYEATKATYDIREQRRIQQIAFKDKASADVALKALRDGSKTFGDVATAAGAKDTDVDLGLITKRSLIDPKIADVAFAIEKDKFSDVIEGTFATVVVRVTQIEPGITKTLADVKDQVRDKLAAEKARAEINGKFDEVEDSRSAGKSLKDIADAMKLSYVEVAAADSRGMTPDGKPVLESPDLAKIAGRVFGTSDGSDADLIDLTNGGHAWVNLLSTQAPKERTFDEVKDQVKGSYMVSEQRRAVGELATKLTERLNNGEPIAAIEEAAGSKAEKTEAITRVTLPQGLSEPAVAQAFALLKGRAGHAENASKESQIVFRVADIVPAAEPTTEQINNLTRDLSADLNNQVLTEYTQSLKARLKATINEVELKRVTGTTGE